MEVINILLGFVAPLFSGCLGGYFYNKILQNKQNHYDYVKSQLDRFYGPVYALILSYETNRKQSQAKKDFSINSNQDDISSDDDDDIMSFLYAKRAHLKTERIYQLTISNIYLVNKEDLNVIKDFWKLFDYHSVAYGSCEYPAVFSLYLENTKLPDEFIKHMKKSFTKLFEERERHKY